jgi:hypothetical protein
VFYALLRARPPSRDPPRGFIYRVDARGSLLFYCVNARGSLRRCRLTRRASRWGVLALSSDLSRPADRGRPAGHQGRVGGRFCGCGSLRGWSTLTRWFVGRIRGSGPNYGVQLKYVRSLAPAKRNPAFEHKPTRARSVLAQRSTAAPRSALSTFPGAAAPAGAQKQRIRRTTVSRRAHAGGAAHASEPPLRCVHTCCTAVGAATAAIHARARSNTRARWRRDGFVARSARRGPPAEQRGAAAYRSTSRAAAAVNTHRALRHTPGRRRTTIRPAQVVNSTKASR